MGYTWKDCPRCGANFAIWVWVHRLMDCVCSKCGGVWFHNNLCPSRSEAGGKA